MVDLSSCYFCGAAMDVSLREYSVVPDALAPTAEQQETVVLCGTCQRKLGRILEPVTAVATADRTNATDGTTNPARAADVDPDGVVTPAEPDRDDADDDGPAVPTGLLDAVNDSTTANDDGTTADDGTTGEDSTTDDGDDGTPFEVDDTASIFDDDDTTPDGQDSIFADGTTSIPDAENTPPTGDGPELGDAVSFSNDTSEESNTTTRSDTTTTETTTSDDDEPDVDPQTYNKVVRLLKNRDLPVSRTEIEDVAGSAYAIPDHECKAIIDAAVTRGLVAEHDGNLVHPDGV